MLLKEKYDRMDWISMRYSEREEGKKEGIKEGIKEGRLELSELIDKLLSEGKTDEVKKIVTNTEYQEAVLKDFNNA